MKGAPANNGTAILEVHSARGPNKRIERPCRITPQRIYVAGRTFERATGRCLSAYHPARQAVSLVSASFTSGGQAFAKG